MINLMNIRYFYRSKISKIIIGLLVIVFIALSYYFRNKSEIRKAQEVLMYSRENNLKNLENMQRNSKDDEIIDFTYDENGFYNPETKSEITTIKKYQTAEEVRNEKIKKFRKIRKKEHDKEVKKRVNKVVQIINREMKPLDEKTKAANKRYEQEKFDSRYSGALKEAYASFKKKSSNKSLKTNREIKRGDVILVSLKMSDKTINAFKDEIDSPEKVDRIIKVLNRNNSLSKNIVDMIKNLDFKNLEAVMINKVGDESVYYDQLVGKKINDSFTMKTSEYTARSSNTEVRQTKNMVDGVVKMYKKTEPEMATLLINLFENVFASYDFKVLDFVDNSVVKKYNLEPVLDAYGFDEMEKRVRTMQKLESDIRSELFD